MNIHLKTDI